jgi:uncharacterized membrane protein YeaQ/YmgE (transglycosylase-associated protein family)
VVSPPLLADLGTAVGAARKTLTSDTASGSPLPETPEASRVFFKDENIVPCRKARGARLLQGRHGWCRHSTRNQIGGVSMGIIVFLIVGLIAGFIARALVPGPDPMGWLGTMVLGIVGSFVGGVLLSLVTTGNFEISATGIIGSIVGAIIVLLIWRAMGGRRGVVA